ncbi:MAG: hypothetical protein WCK02_06800 [Bacteroidota bacterium]
MATIINTEVKENIKTASTNKLAVFIVFFIISFVFWVLNYLSNDYTSSYYYKIKFEQFPTNKILVGKPLATVSLKLRAKGFKLIKKNISLSENKISLKVESMKMVNSLENTYYIDLSKYSSQISTMIGPDYQLVDISPDTIFFKFDNYYSRKIPVKLNIEINPKKQYRLSREIVFKPDSLLVSGTRRVLDTMKFINTNYRKYNNIDKSFIGSISINEELTNDYNLFYEVHNVNYNCEIEKYTEEKCVLNVVGVPSNIQIQTLPEMVNVYYKVNIKDYNKVSSNSFKLGVDIVKFGNKSGNIALVEVLKKPDFVEITRIVPDRVEYIIKK